MRSSYPKSIRACSKLASGIKVYCCAKRKDVKKISPKISIDFFIVIRFLISYNFSRQQYTTLKAENQVRSKCQKKNRRWYQINIKAKKVVNINV
jgi:hypothetical protein